MSFSPKTFTQEINLLQAWKQDLRQRLSSTLSSTEQETQRSALSSVEARRTAQSLSNDFYEIRLLLNLYEIALAEQVVAASSEVLTDVDFKSGQNTRH